MFSSLSMAKLLVSTAKQRHLQSDLSMWYSLLHRFWHCSVWPSRPPHPPSNSRTVRTCLQLKVWFWCIYHKSDDIIWNFRTTFIRCRPWGWRFRLGWWWACEKCISFDLDDQNLIHLKTEPRSSDVAAPEDEDLDFDDGRWHKWVWNISEQGLIYTFVRRAPIYWFWARICRGWRRRRFQLLRFGARHEGWDAGARGRRRQLWGTGPLQQGCLLVIRLWVKIIALWFKFKTCDAEFLTSQ